MSDQSHDLYKDLAKEINLLGKDLAKGLQGVSFLVNKTADDLKDLRQDYAKSDLAGHQRNVAYESRLVKLETQLQTMSEVPQRLAVIESLIRDLQENKKDVTGKVHALQLEQGNRKFDTENNKARLGFKAAVVAAAVPGLVSLILKLLELLK